MKSDGWGKAIKGCLKKIGISDLCKIIQTIINIINFFIR